MKKYLLILALITFSFSFSQIKTPQPSPATSINQMVGLTEFEVEYSRPSMRGREIFGDLVPYNQIWRTGANSSTKISFSTDVQINGQVIKSGKYSLFTVPKESEWEIIFYNDTELWGVPQDWDDKKVVFKTSIHLQRFPDSISIETFSIEFKTLDNNYVILTISWDDVYVPITIDVPTRKMVEKNIEDVISKQPKASDYYAAAVFYRQENINIEKSVEWIDKAIEMSDKVQYWQLRQQSLIYAANGNIKGAIKVAKKSLEAAKIAGNKDYVKMNKDSIEEWSN